MMSRGIYIWGDSIARGIVYNEAKGKYAISRERFTSRLQSELGLKVENFSKMGATVLDGLSSFESFTPVEHALCVIEFGGNDCDPNWADVAEHPEKNFVPKVCLEEYAQKLKEFVLKVRQRGMKPLLVTPAPLHPQRYFDWVTRNLDRERVLHALGDVGFIYRWQERYAVAMRDVASELHCSLFDMRDLLLSRRDFQQLLCVDGIHPNDEGYRLIADNAVNAAMAKISKPAC